MNLSPEQKCWGAPHSRLFSNLAWRHHQGTRWWLIGGSYDPCRGCQRFREVHGRRIFQDIAGMHRHLVRIIPRPDLRIDQDQIPESKVLHRARDRA